jgi:hypothetical protein
LLGRGGLLTVGLLLSGNEMAAAEQPSARHTLLERALLEMRDTRNFLADWFAGRQQQPERPEDFYLNKVLARNFTIVRPNGLRLNRDQTLQIFFDRLHGSEPTVLHHENINIQPILEREDVVVVGYDERHVYTDHATVNALTAVLVHDQSAPNGVRWQVVHETPIGTESA